MANCIHCGRAMFCTTGVAHHKCSRLAEKELLRRRKAMLDDITTIRDLCKKLKKLEEE